MKLMPTTNLPALATASKAQIKKTAMEDVQTACELSSAAEVAVHLARAELYVKYLRKYSRELTKESLLREGKQQLQGAEIEIRQSVTYEYVDPIVADLEAKLEARKEYLKTVKPGQHLEEVDPATGEVFRVQPAIKKGTDTIFITIK